MENVNSNPPLGGVKANGALSKQNQGWDAQNQELHSINTLIAKILLAC